MRRTPEVELSESPARTFPALLTRELNLLAEIRKFSEENAFEVLFHKLSLLRVSERKNAVEEIH